MLLIHSKVENINLVSGKTIIIIFIFDLKVDLILSNWDDLLYWEK